MRLLKVSFQKLITIVAVIVLVFILFSSAVSLYSVKNDEEIRGILVAAENLKEYEKILSSSNDVITLDGITYEKAEFEQRLKEEKKELNGQLLLFRLLRFVSIVLIIISAFCLFLIGIWPFRCKKCKKWFAVQNRDTIQTKSEKIYMVVENKTRSAYSGEVTATTEQHIPGKRNTYKTTYVCKYCGAEKYKYKTVDTPNT